MIRDGTDLKHAAEFIVLRFEVWLDCWKWMLVAMETTRTKMAMKKGDGNDRDKNKWEVGSQ